MMREFARAWSTSLVKIWRWGCLEKKWGRLQTLVMHPLFHSIANVERRMFARRLANVVMANARIAQESRAVSVMKGSYVKRGSIVMIAACVTHVGLKITRVVLR
jgi:hypothetical protein